MKLLLGILGAILTLAYPLAVYFGLTHFSVRAVGLLLLCLALPMIALRLRGKKREHLSAVLPAPLAVIALIALSAILEDRRFMLALPVLISAALLVTFGASLVRGMPMIERFARMQNPDLPPDHAEHCRQVTWVWCGFFVVNGAIASFLAIRGPLEWWTLYSGLIAYVLMGVLFAAEYMVRKIRFRHEQRSQ
jgi:uncharacterized membrane protein